MNWWQDPGEVARLMRWLWEEEDIGIAEAVALASKPWNWEDEYQDMCRKQDGDLSDMLQASLNVVRAHRAGGGR